MEEVWKDISLSSLHHPTTAACPHHTLHELNLQDFLASPSTKVPPPPRNDSYEPSSARCGGATAFGSLRPPPATVLSLSSGSDHQFYNLESSDQTTGRLRTRSLVSSTAVFPSFSNKRASENDEIDRRHKRLMKNRESADRSRARKQAYTNELENEVGRLLKENAKLRRQLEKVYSDASSPQLPKKHTLHRTLTAPF